MHLRSSKEPERRGRSAEDGSGADERSLEMSDDRWSRIKTRFVDDPGGALDEAVGMVDETLDDLVQQVRSRLDRLRDTGDRDRESSTEEMRQRLHECRTILDQLSAHPLLH